jgi:5-methylcytosine-specific restriction enzyme B
VIEEDEQAETDDETLAVVETYGIADIIAEGGFLGQEALAGLIERLGSKKNLILQGPRAPARLGLPSASPRR